MKKIALILWTSLCLITGVTGAVWEHRTAPAPTLPEAAEEFSYARPGISRLMQHAHTAPKASVLHYIIRVPNEEKSRIGEHLYHISPNLGWYSRANLRYQKILATMPESDLEKVEALAANPVAWTLNALQSPPATSFQTENPVNVSIDIVGYRKRSWTSFTLALVGNTSLAITALILAAIWISREPKARNQCC